MSLCQCGHPQCNLRNQPIETDSDLQQHVERTLRENGWQVVPVVPLRYCCRRNYSFFVTFMSGDIQRHYHNDVVQRMQRRLQQLWSKECSRIVVEVETVFMPTHPNHLVSKFDDSRTSFVRNYRMYVCC